MCLFVFAACGAEEEAPIPEAQTPETPGEIQPPTGDEAIVPVGEGQAETLSDAAFDLNTEQPVPPAFSEAYGRRARIVVQFYKLEEDTLDYPQGLSVDRQMSAAMEELSGQYPTIEFFSYDISNPGPADQSRDLDEGEYGTLAAQLGVGSTPFVAMLAPSGDGYVITNLFQGYTPEPVLSQALFDLAAVEVEDNTSDVNVVIESLQLTESGGGIEYFTVQNRTDQTVDLQGFTVRVLDPETAQVDPDAPGVTINTNVSVPPQESVSIGRVPDVVASGQPVQGTFEGGAALDLGPGDQVALLDPGGAIASTTTV